MNPRRMMFLLLVIANLAVLPVRAKAQTLSDSGDSSSIVASAAPAQTDLTYTRPTSKTKLHNYLFDTVGPYPIVEAAAWAGIGQFDNEPPEWNQGAKGYAKRFGSDLGIAAVSTTTRYALAEVFKEDTLYYRSDRTGLFPRLNHAIISTVTARRGEDGHRTFSLSALIAPYAGPTVAVYGWYPDRFGMKDAFRMGNYNLLGFVGANIASEFFYSGPHSIFSRLHLTNSHVAPDPDSGR